MKAVKVHELGGPEVLRYEDAEQPHPGNNEVLIEVHASSINPIDTKSIQRDSKYQSTSQLPLTPGLDVAGVVITTGTGINNIQAGNKVYGQASSMRGGTGAFAEYAVTSEDAIALMPDNISFTEAAAVPLAASSAYQALMEHIRLQRGQKILIHGGSGGIGTFAIQLAKHLGAHVATTASGEGIEYAKQQGADEAIDYKAEAFEKRLKDFDAVLDTVGGETYAKSFEVLKKGGILVSMLEQPHERLMKQHGVHAVLEMTKVTRKVLAEITLLIEQGVLKVNIAKTFPLNHMKEAYEAKESDKILGKIAVEVKR